MELLKFNIEHVFCIGDIHGDFESVIGWIKRYELTDCALIFCGDCGFGFNKLEYYKQTLSKIKKVCKKNNVYCLFGRGNHDDPEYFDCKLFKKGFVRTLRDYTVLQFYGKDDTEFVSVPNKTILWVGGAISIDRTYRIKETERNAHNYARWHNGISFDEALKKCRQIYWENEPPVFDINKLNEITESGLKIDVVCTHTSPSFCEPHNKNNIGSWLQVDENLEEDIDKERIVMDGIYHYLIENNHPLRKWYYAHYHFHTFQEYDGVKYYLLDMSHYGNFDMIEIRLL